MEYIALTSFTGEIEMRQGEVRELDSSLAEDLLGAGYIEEYQGGGGGGGISVNADSYTVNTLEWDGSTTDRDTATMSIGGGMLTFTAYKVSNDTNVSIVVGTMECTIGGETVKPQTSAIVSDTLEGAGYLDESYNMYTILICRDTSASGTLFGSYPYTLTAQSTGVYFCGINSADVCKAESHPAVVGSVADKLLYDGEVTANSGVGNMSEWHMELGHQYKVQWRGETYEAYAEQSDGTINHANLVIKLSADATVVYYGSALWPCEVVDATMVDDESYSIKVWEMIEAVIPLSLIEGGRETFVVGAVYSDDLSGYTLQSTWREISDAFQLGKAVIALTADSPRQMWYLDSAWLSSFQGYGYMCTFFRRGSLDAFEVMTFSAQTIDDYPTPWTAPN